MNGHTNIISADIEKNKWLGDDQQDLLKKKKKHQKSFEYTLRIHKT